MAHYCVSIPGLPHPCNPVAILLLAARSRNLALAPTIMPPEGVSGFSPLNNLRYPSAATNSQFSMALFGAESQFLIGLARIGIRRLFNYRIRIVHDEIGQSGLVPEIRIGVGEIGGE